MSQQDGLAGPGKGSQHLRAGCDAATEMEIAYTLPERAPLTASGLTLAQVTHLPGVTQSLKPGMSTQVVRPWIVHFFNFLIF